MKKRFIILLEKSAPVFSNAFIAYVEVKGWGFWHWFPDSFLIVDNSGTTTLEALRDDVRKHFPNSFNLVVEVPRNGGNWAGFGPNTPSNDMAAWLRQVWNP